ncbi:MAG: hypothetical protein ACKVKJ_01295 [Fidelibacterota bacterium]|jgi:hypothetical protein|tara:strand:- start:773 stop:1723 length:951 start_codon:yes stop_codon:yes gene_type:complete
MKKLSLLIALTTFAMIGCENLSKEDITVIDPELQSFSDGLNNDIGLSKSSISAFNDALNRHGKNGKHRNDPGFLWKVSAEMQTELSDEEKTKLFGWMDDNSTPYLFAADMGPKSSRGPKDDKGKKHLDIKMLFTLLDETQTTSLKTIMESYKSQMDEVMKKSKDGTLDRDSAKAELEALEVAMHAEIKAILTDEQKQKLEEIHLEMKQKMEQMRQAGHDAMVNALSMTSLQEDGLDSINKESNEVQKALMEKAKAEEMTKDDMHEALKALFAERNSKIDALFDDTQMEIIKIYTSLVMQYSKHCGDRKKDSGGDKR